MSQDSCLLLIFNINGICRAKRSAKCSAEENAATEFKWGYLKHLILLLVLWVKFFTVAQRNVI